MQVYIKTKGDWNMFIDGFIIEAYKTEIPNYYKKINVGSNEVISKKGNIVKIIKKY